ncbi:hypothetical protein HY502_03845 [Candidatus Woesebacteria bacterium]|nr:hypothetical protein [Candidatus Woesebacteria bacterium]
MGLSGLALIVFFLAHLFPIKVALIAAVIMSFLIPLFFKKKFGFELPRPKVNKIFFINSLFWGIIFSLILWQTTLKPTGDFFNASPSTYGDLPFHLNLITNFAYGNNFPPVNPLSPPIKLNYHFLADFISAIILVLSGNLRFSLIVPGVVMGTLTASAISLFVFRIGKSQLAALIAPFLFFMNGGIGFVKFFTNLADSKDWLFVPFRYAHIPEWGVEYPNILAEIMMAERTLFIGFPLAVFVLFFLYIWTQKNEKSAVILSGLGLGLLLYANVYGFLTLGLLMMVMLLRNLLRRNPNRALDLFYSLSIAFIIAFPLVLGIVTKIGSSINGFIRFSPGEWPPLPGGKQKLVFWITNFGLVPILSFIAIFKKGLISTKVRQVLGPLFLMVFLAHIVIFQPYSWDNNRFILYPYLAMSIFSSFVFVRIIQNANKGLRIFGLAFLGMSILSGFLVVYYDPQISSHLYSREDFELAEFVNKETDRSYNFLTSQSHNHPVASLAGRKVVLGYEGYLWTHGVEDLEKKYQDIKTIYSYEDQSPWLLHLYNVGYVVFGPSEKEEFPSLQEEEFIKRYSLIYNSDNYKIFDTRDLRIR